MMSGKSRDESELFDLLSAGWDGRLDYASRARLEELLSREDFPAIERLTAFTRLHLDLEWLSSSRTAQQKAVEALKRAALVGERDRRRRRLTVGGLAALAAVVLVTVIGRWYFARPGIDGLVRAPQRVGQVARLEDPQWARGTRLQSGDALVEGQSVDIQKGYAQLSMGSGADVLLEGPCRVRIVSSDRVALEGGRLAVRAAQWAVGFKVETDDLVATDLGTWFSMQSGGGQSEIHVLQGLVHANSRKQRGSARAAQVHADEAVQLSVEGAFEPIAFRRDVAAERLTQFRPLRPVQIWNTGIGLREGGEDPHWTVTAGHEHSRPYPQPAVVGVPHKSYGVNEPERSQWVSVERGTSNGVPARSTYTFETTFDLSGFDLDSVWVSGLILADDGVDAVRLNGKRLNIQPWTDWQYGINYVKFHPIEIRSGFVPGVNRLAFVVKNESFIVPTDQGFDVPDTPNPMALRAEWQAFGRPAGGGH